MREKHDSLVFYVLKGFNESDELLMILIIISYLIATFVAFPIGVDRRTSLQKGVSLNYLKHFINQ